MTLINLINRYFIEYLLHARHCTNYLIIKKKKQLKNTLRVISVCSVNTFINSEIMYYPI